MRNAVSVANPWEYLCRTLFTTLSHTFSGHILPMSFPFMSLQWPVLPAVLHNFLLSWCSQPTSMHAYLCGFISGNTLCPHQASWHIGVHCPLAHRIVSMPRLWCDHSKQYNLWRSPQNQWPQAVHSLRRRKTCTMNEWGRYKTWCF